MDVMNSTLEVVKLYLVVFGCVGSFSVAVRFLVGCWNTLCGVFRVVDFTNDGAASPVARGRRPRTSVPALGPLAFSAVALFSTLNFLLRYVDVMMDYFVSSLLRDGKPLELAVGKLTDYYQAKHSVVTKKYVAATLLPFVLIKTVVVTKNLVHIVAMPKDQLSRSVTLVDLLDAVVFFVSLYLSLSVVGPAERQVYASIAESDGDFFPWEMSSLLSSFEVLKLWHGLCLAQSLALVALTIARHFFVNQSLVGSLAPLCVTLGGPGVVKNVKEGKVVVGKGKQVENGRVEEPEQEQANGVDKTTLSPTRERAPSRTQQNGTSVAAPLTPVVVVSEQVDGSTVTVSVGEDQRADEQAGQGEPTESVGSTESVLGGSSETVQSGQANTREASPARSCPQLRAPQSESDVNGPSTAVYKSQQASGHAIAIDAESVQREARKIAEQVIGAVLSNAVVAATNEKPKKKPSTGDHPTTPRRKVIRKVVYSSNSKATPPRKALAGTPRKLMSPLEKDPDHAEEDNAQNMLMGVTALATGIFVVNQVRRLVK